ncbi:hypothetical protein ABZ734_24075 [Streptomyces sp. NPDC006660]|uniref:hypothetical protein n=1 Tax=Streptomyces sp. NPDC006660 TaxID=3156901 RepID=UPI0033D64905
MAERRGGTRGGRPGPAHRRKQKLVFTYRLLVMLVSMRLRLPHTALAELFRVNRSTIAAAVRDTGVAS